MRKILYNRSEPDTNELKAKQNFDAVLKKYHETQYDWKNPWFYGIVGFASITLFIVLLAF